MTKRTQEEAEANKPDDVLRRMLNTMPKQHPKPAEKAATSPTKKPSKAK